jgi:hypothetical protein
MLEYIYTNVRSENHAVPHANCFRIMRINVSDALIKKNKELIILNSLIGLIFSISISKII